MRSWGLLVAPLAGLLCACAPPPQTPGPTERPDMAGPTFVSRYVIDSLRLWRDPHVADPRAFAIDLNGDGKLDNRFGSIVGTLLSLGIDYRPALDAQVALGLPSYVIALQTTNTGRVTDALFEWAKPAGGGTPDLSGKGQFTVGATDPVTHFKGNTYDVRQLQSVNPAYSRTDLALLLNLPLWDASDPPAAFIPLTLHGAFITATISTDVKTGAPVLVDGQINGAVTNDDFQRSVLPVVAHLVTSRLPMDCSGPSSDKCPALAFDTGKCENLDGTKALAGDQRIDPCELTNNDFIRPITQPDVQLFDANGNYAPSASNTNKDSLSFGLGFTAIRADF